MRLETSFQNRKTIGRRVLILIGVAFQLAWFVLFSLAWKKPGSEPQATEPWLFAYRFTLRFVTN